MCGDNDSDYIDSENPAGPHDDGGDIGNDTVAGDLADYDDYDD